MATINQLSAQEILANSDQFVIYSSSNGDARKMAASSLLTYITSNITQGKSKFILKKDAPVTGGTTTLNDDSTDQWGLITPLAGLVTLTIVFPGSTHAIEGQEILINCTQAVTTVTWSSSGATFVGAPTSFVAEDYLRFKYEPVTKKWYRVG